ncbi:hypothetical protein [Amycolatopsis sp. NPDC051716]|uniref:hypothetical protein n=1 Tax=Amycolatopsis sp. NPDC051716 TaxID=3155804 RepID=UPI0034121055
MSEQRSSIVGRMDQAVTNLRMVTERFKHGMATKQELLETNSLLLVLADVLKLYADKMPDEESDGRHALKEPPP